MNRSAAHDSLVRACVTLLAFHKIPAYAVNQVTHQRKDGQWRAAGAPKGFPDIVAVLPPKGRLLAIECKTGKSKARVDQVLVLATLHDAGAAVVIIHDVLELQAWIQEFVL